MTADPLSLTLAKLVAEHVTGDWTVQAIVGGVRLTPAAVECLETVCDLRVSAQTVIIICERSTKGST